MTTAPQHPTAKHHPTAPHHPTAQPHPIVRNQPTPWLHAPAPQAFAETQATTRQQWSRQGQEALDLSAGNVTCDDPKNFRSRGVLWTFGDVIASDVVMTPCSITPTFEEATGDADYVSVVFIMTGGFTIFDGSQPFTVSKGGSGWFPGWTRVTATNQHTSRFARVSVPRCALNGVEKRHRPFGVFKSQMMLTAPALSFVLELMHTTDERSLREARPRSVGSTSNGHPAAAVLTQLVSGLFIEQAGFRLDSTDLTSGLWAQAMAVIDREFANPMLDPGALADRLHVSLRHLQRAFAQNGATISDAVRERRAAAVVATMTGGTSPYLSLGEVALMNGFSSIKEMRFALRSKHGMTPSEFRTTSLAAAG
ncbi:AraC family transcriptional regulator [Subtercola boreus]|nr:helix-turn-helix domain-containing protein [Subtercola boreus]